MNNSGYSGTPLSHKLGIKEDQTVILYNQPDHYFTFFTDFPKVDLVTVARAESVDLIHFFCTHLEELERNFDALKSRLKMNGSFWVSWPKGSSKIAKNLDGNIVRRFGLTHGLVDVKVCAIDADWSGLKFMYRLKDRK